MAGENIQPCTTNGIASVDYNLPADGARGDLVRAGNLNCFLLQDGKAGETVAACYACDLVVIPHWGQTAKSGERIIFEDGGFKKETGKTINNNRRFLAVGFLHRSVSKDDALAEVVWRNI